MSRDQGFYRVQTGTTVISMMFRAFPQVFPTCSLPLSNHFVKPCFRYRVEPVPKTTETNDNERPSTLPAAAVVYGSKDAAAAAAAAYCDG